jgi:hypothetical protein
MSRQRFRLYLCIGATIGFFLMMWGDGWIIVDSVIAGGVFFIIASLIFGLYMPYLESGHV